MMQKNALAITVTTLVMGVFGAFLRWLQNRLAFDDAGLAIPGAPVSVVYLVFSLLMLAGMLGIVFLWLNRFEKPEFGEDALRVGSALPTVLSWVFCTAFAAAGVLLMFSAGDSRLSLLQRLFGAAAVIAGACLPAMPARQVYENAGVIGKRAASVILVVFFGLWLVFSYLTHADEPVLWIYVPEVLAVAASLLAFYYVAAWFFGRAKPNSAFLFLQLGAFLDLCTLPDARKRSVTLLLAATAAMLLMLEYVVLSNLTEKQDEE